MSHRSHAIHDILCFAAFFGLAVTASRCLRAHADPPSQASQWWSFQPVHRATPPAVRDPSWVRNPIDNFILAKLEQEGLEPAAEADKTTLLRRVTFDLTGLPPTPQEIRAFLADHSPDAYEKVVDRLLASPHYGERWGRHWLDVARYVQGRITFPGIKNTGGDQAYRDYVVRAFNEDKPYDQFVTEQLAGDLLPPSNDRQQEFDQIAAPAFLSIGGWFDMCTDPNRLRLEMVDDMINVTSQSFLGLTVSCARCHDHKFDPIPARDYYALAGVFGSTRIVGQFSEYWRDGRTRLLTPLAMPDEVAANDELLAKITQEKDQRWAALSGEYQKRMEEWSANETRYRAAAAKLPKPFVHLWKAENFDGEHNLRIAQLSKDGHSVDVIETLMPEQQWAKYKIEVPEAGKYVLEALYSAGEKSPLTLEVNGTAVTTDAFAEPTGGWELQYQKWQTVGVLDLDQGLNFLRFEARAGDFPRLDRFRLYRKDESIERQASHVARSEKLDPMILADFVHDADQPWPEVSDMVGFADPATRSQVDQIDRAIEALNSQIKPYPLVVSVTDQSHPTDLPVHIRGDVYQVSKEAVPRGMPALLDEALPRPQIAPQHSGRLELARWITDPRNPLTARVMVNRIWQHHFGRGIVATPSDFGTRGSPPTHPQLLDWLASEFVDPSTGSGPGHGWSMKHIHRLICTSAAYRMESHADPKAQAHDPDNRLLSHVNRQRLEVEALYDAMVSTTNNLVRQESGKPLDLNKSKNRAMYVLAANRSPKGLGPEVRKMFSVFDYDGTPAPLPVRLTSSTPAQSLFWLNSPLVKYEAGRFAERLLKMDRLNDAKRVEMAYLLALGRTPTEDESRAAQAYLTQCVEEDRMSAQEAWTEFCQALYASAEFSFIE